MPVQNPPEEGLIDKVGKLIKAGIDSLPSGTIMTELLLLFIKTPYQKRSQEWQQDVTDTLNKIQEEGIDLEDLGNNEEFIDILLQSIPIALRNHQEEKRNALRNAIFHSAQADAPGLSLQQAFLNCIDTFTVWHIRILMLFADPVKWFKHNGKVLPGIGGVGSVKGTLENAFPDLRGQDDFLNYIWNELYNKGFLSSDKSLLHVMMTSQGPLEKRTTILGDQFIDFVSD